MLTKRTSKILALLTAVCLILTLIPLTVFAEGEGIIDNGQLPIDNEGNGETEAGETATPTEKTPEATPAQTTEETSEEETETTTEDPAEEEPAMLTDAATDPVEVEVLAAAAEIGTRAVISLIVDDQSVTPDQSGNANGNGSDGGTWEWEADTNTLTLDGYSGGAIGIACDAGDEIKLVLSGASIADGDGEDYGIACNGSLAISGSGTLTVTGDKNGISAGGNLTISDGTVNATGGEEAGIFAVGGLTISGGTVNATGDLTGISCAGSLVISGDGSVVAKGANGISVTGALSISGGANVTATGGEEAGISAVGDITISGGEVTVNGNVSGDLTVEDGDVTVTGIAVGDLTISGGEVTVNGNVSGDLTVTGGDVTVGGQSITPSVSGSMTINGVSVPDISNNADDSGWSWVASTATLTLNNYNGSKIAINCGSSDTINLELVGNSTVTDNTYLGAGISCAGSLVISGDGSVAATATGGLGDGIKVSGVLSIIGGEVKATGKEGAGIAGKEISISGNANVTSVSTDSAGINVSEVLSISGGTVVATGKNGISGNGVSISGTANVTATGTTNAGIYGAPISISGGSGTIKGTKFAVEAIGTLETPGVTVPGARIGAGDGAANTFLDTTTGDPLKNISFYKTPEPDSTPEPDPKPESPVSHSNSSSDNDSGSSYNPPIADDWLDPDEARPLAANSKRQNLDYARTFRANRYGVRGRSWTALKDLRFYHDTVLGGAVQVRTYFDDLALFTKDVRVSGYVAGFAANSIRGLFEKWFTNEVRVIHFDQAGEWENPIKVAAKVDLAGIDTAKLVLYSYDPDTNSYRRIVNPEYWIDTNGYLHFETAYAGEIIISEGELTKH